MPPMQPNSDPFADILLGYRPRSPWDDLDPDMRAIAGPNPYQDPIGSAMRESLGLPGWRSQPSNYITPEQKDTALKMLGRGAMTSVGAVGGFLDKYTGSRALRGLTGAALNAFDPQGGHKGSWRDALSILPFSDALGITDPTQSVTGKEVFGIKNDPSSYMDDVKGFAADVLLDPTLFVGGFLKGGLTAGGKALKAAGGLRDVDWALKAASSAAGKSTGRLAARGGTVLGDALKALPDQELASTLMGKLSSAAGNPSVLDDWLKAPIGTSLDVGVPFSEKMRTGFNVPGVDRARDWMFDKASGSLPGRLIQNQLYAPAKGMKTKLGQDVAKQVSYVQGKTPEFVEAILEEASALKAAGEYTPQDAMKKFSQYEGFVANQNPNAIDELVNQVNTTIKKEREELAIGSNLNDDFIRRHVARQGIQGDKAAAASHTPRDYMPVLDSKGQDLARSAALKDFRGGTASVMEMMMDPQLQAIKDGKGWQRKITDYLKRKYDPATNDVIPKHMANPELLDELASVIHRTPLEVMQKGFYEHPLESLYGYLIRHRDKVAISRAQIELMAHGAQAASKITDPSKLASFSDLFARRPRGEQWVTSSSMDPHNPIYKDLAEVAKHKGKNPMDGGAYIEYIKKYGADADKTQMEYYKNLWDQAVTSGNATLYDQAVNGTPGVQGAKEWLEEFGQRTKVSKDVMDDVVRWDSMFRPGEQISELGKWWDKATNLFKVGVLTWPARYVRDLFSGQVQNVMLNQWSARGATDALTYISKGIVKNPKEYLQHLPAARLNAMTDDQAMKALNAHLAATGILGEQHSAIAQIGNVAPKRGLEGLLENMPGQGVSPLKAAAGELKGLKTKAGWNPLGFRGVMGDETTNVVGRIGDIAGRTTDNANRLVAYLTLKRRGVDTNEAIRRVMSSQVDYSTKTLTQTERQILTRAFPFWRYSSKMFPFVFQEILDRPGGLMAQSIRNTGRLGSGKEEFVPEHLRQSAAIPLGGFLGSKDPKRQRYLTGFGFMHEDPLSVFQPGHSWGSTAQNALQDLLGRANPIIKAPVELAFGKQLFSGRDLADLDGSLARIVSNVTGKEPPQTSMLLEHALANSPAARLLTSVRTATDPAKGYGAKALNLLSGARVSDVDMEKARSIAIRSSIEDMMRGERAVRTLRPHMYVREEDRAKLDPASLLLMDLYRQQLAESKRAKMDKARGLSVQEILRIARGEDSLDLGGGIP